MKIEYAIDRFTMEAKRQLDVLDKQLARGRYVAGEEYTCLLYTSTFALAFLAALMLVWLDDRIAETD